MGRSVGPKVILQINAHGMFCMKHGRISFHHESANLNNEKVTQMCAALVSLSVERNI